MILQWTFPLIICWISVCWVYMKGSWIWVCCDKHWAKSCGLLRTRSINVFSSVRSLTGCFMGLPFIPCTNRWLAFCPTTHCVTLLVCKEVTEISCDYCHGFPLTTFVMGIRMSQAPFNPEGFCGWGIHFFICLWAPSKFISFFHQYNIGLIWVICILTPLIYHPSVKIWRWFGRDFSLGLVA